MFLKISSFNVYALEKIMPRYYDFVIYSKAVLTLKVPLNFSIKLEILRKKFEFDYVVRFEFKLILRKKNPFDHK